jgi:predicted dehydrogenase
MKTSLPLTRRNFLKSTILAGTAPLLLPRRMWGAEASANEKLTLGFIGMGKQNSSLMHGFIRRSDTRVVAVCDVDTTRRENAKKTVEAYYGDQMKSGAYKGCATHNDFQELLARKDIDAVVIATPDHWHAIIAIAAADAGKDIYCEKPMAHSIHEGRAMVQAVRRNKRIFQVGSMQRSSREFRVACELVRNGVLGKIQRVEVAVGGPGVPCDLPEETAEPGLDWDRWLGPAPVRPYNSVLSPRGVHDHFPAWRNYREYGGGMVTDWGAHHFDIAQWGLGFDESGPIEFTPAEKAGAQNGARFRYANGVEVMHIGGNGVTFFAEKGKLYVNRGKFELSLDGQPKRDDPRTCDQVAKELLPPNAIRLYNSSNHLSDWVNSVRTRKAPICDVEVGARTTAVCNLVNLTYYHRQVIKWDPKTESFTGGTGNPKWLDYEYRAPWKVVAS